MRLHRENSVSPAAWNATFSGPPTFTSGESLPRGSVLRRWSGTSSDMRQPVLTSHLVIVHLGGSKRVQRTGEGDRTTADLDEGAITIAPSGSHYEWSTQGPIDFAHFYIDPKSLERTVVEIFDRDPKAASLQERLGSTDKLLQASIECLLADCNSDEVIPRLYLESIVDSVLVRVTRLATNASALPLGLRQAMSSRKLQRVKDFVREHISDDLSLDMLAGVAGLSRYHFSHVFRDTTGLSPYNYVTRTRVELAKSRLGDTAEPLADIAKLCGFASAIQFSRTFKKVVGLTPNEWRRQG